LKIPTICQRLSRCGQELDDNSVTVGSLGLLINDVLDLREVEDGDSSTAEDVTRAKKRRREERGFGGTLLASSRPVPVADATLSSEGEAQQSQSEHDPVQVCQACTYENPANSLHCEMCHCDFKLGGTSFLGIV